VLRGNRFRVTVVGMFDEQPTFMPALDDVGDPTDGIVAIHDHILTRHIWLRRYDEISADGITRWPVSVYVQAEDLDADRARLLAAELLAAADRIDRGDRTQQ
jgi:hypothetical protein